MTDLDCEIVVIKKNLCIHGKKKYYCKECDGGRFCKHNKDKYACKECNKDRFCEHNRKTYNCKECGGGRFCKHNKEKYDCKECNKDRFCKHDKIKKYCQECDGSGLCIHNKRKYYCRECGGGRFCKHNKGKYDCKECNKNKLCEHNKEKYDCRACHKNKLCEHDKIKKYCQECDGSGLCIHDKKKYYCNKCNTNNICEHNKNKHDCKYCNKNRFCTHGKRKSDCKECKGNRICIHDKRKDTCHICDKDKHPEKWCKLCKFINVKSSNYKPYCFYCYCVMNPDAEIERQYKLKEHHLRDELIETYPKIQMIFDKKVNDGCSLRRPDVRIECFTHTIIIECDENKHIGYSCENKRIMEIFQDLGNRPIVFLRFNPDQYKDAHGITIQGCFNKKSINDEEWTKRIKILKEKLNHHYNNIPIKEITVEELFY